MLKVWIVAASPAVPRPHLKKDVIVAVYPLLSPGHSQKCGLWLHIPCGLGDTPKNHVGCGCVPCHLGATSKVQVAAYPLMSQSHTQKGVRIVAVSPNRLGATPKNCVDCGCVFLDTYGTQPETVWTAAPYLLPSWGHTQKTAWIVAAHPLPL